MESCEGTDTFQDNLTCLSIEAMISETPVLNQSNYTAKEKRNYKDIHCTVEAIKYKYFPSFNTYKLSRMWSIWLKSAIKILETITQKSIRSTGLLAKQFITEKFQPQYKHISHW